MADIFLRRDVNGITPMDLKYMNDNFKYIWLKVFGNITTGDLLDSSITEDPGFQRVPAICYKEYCKGQLLYNTG
jgi:hypothetical protein